MRSARVVVAQAEPMTPTVALAATDLERWLEAP